MKKYTVSVIANVTIQLIMECENEQEAKNIADGMDYDQLLDEGVSTIYSTEEVDIDQDIKEYEQKDFERMDPIDRKIGKIVSSDIPVEEKLRQMKELLK